MKYTEKRIYSKEDYNDYEIIDLAKSGNSDALQLLFDKYSNLIRKMIYKFNFVKDFEDYMQIGLETLYKSVVKYSDAYNKTFTRYFEMNLKRKFISICTKEYRRKQIYDVNVKDIYTNFINEDNEFYLYKDDLKKAFKLLTDLEKEVYISKLINNEQVESIGFRLSIPKKSIYNSLHRAKNKLREYFKKLEQ